MRPKRLLILGILFLLIQCADNKTSDYTIEAIHTPASPVIDGVENDPIWQHITPVVLKENGSGNEVQESEPFSFYVMIRIYGHLLPKRMNIYGRMKR
jgi:hypothetical protein